MIASTMKVPGVSFGEANLNTLHDSLSPLMISLFE
jgi:hypothetical protein